MGTVTRERRRIQRNGRGLLWTGEPRKRWTEKDEQEPASGGDRASSQL